MSIVSIVSIVVAEKAAGATRRRCSAAFSCLPAEDLHVLLGFVSRVSGSFPLKDELPRQIRRCQGRWSERLCRCSVRLPQKVSLEAFLAQNDAPLCTPQWFFSDHLCVACLKSNRFLPSGRANSRFPNGAIWWRPLSTRNLLPTMKTGSTPDAPRSLATFTIVNLSVSTCLLKHSSYAELLQELPTIKPFTQLASP